MSDHANDIPEQRTSAEDPIAATGREQRDYAAASPTAGTPADVRQEYAQPDLSDAAAQGAAPHTSTTDHDVIRQWAEDRHAAPATVEGTEHGGNVGELRLDFDFGNDLEDLRQVSWDEWFAAFDERGLEFVYQETARADGSPSNDFRLETRGATR
ncbi:MULTISPECIES: hypothetical protein [Microbacterium]|uniref:hypothetical protein n=1 Tax=Microbacterium TaxID=33882 RepID=UPI0018E0A7A7|nr:MULTISPECIES: hypothetical protein [Microbacterium]